MKCCIAVLLIWTALALGQESSALSLNTRVALPGVQGRLDHFSVEVLDTDTGKEVGRVPVAGSCDDVYFDSERKRIYALGGEDFISVVQQTDPSHYTLSANIQTTVGVRTGVFFGTSLYAGVPAAGLEPAQIWNYAVPE